jgi:predicted phosphodiesterase
LACQHVATVRVAALYDIHANLPALDAVLAEVEREGADTIVVGGDVVPGPMPVETIERLRALGDRALFVRGNGDRWVMEAFDASASLGEEDDHPGRPWVTWTAAAIDRPDLLASFADRVVLDVDGLGPTLFCHGSPRDDEELLTALTPERRWRPALKGVAKDVVVRTIRFCLHDRRLPLPRRILEASASSSASWNPLR